MENNRQTNIMTFISMIISLALIIFNIYVLIQYINHNTEYLTLSGILNILELIFLSHFKGLAVLIPLSIGSIIALKDIWNGICFALLIENVFSGVFGIILYLIAFINISNEKKLKTNKLDGIKKTKSLFTKFEIVLSIVCSLSIIASTVLGIEYYYSQKEINEINTELINEIKDRKRFENLYYYYMDSADFLNSYVAIVPTNEKVYLNYKRWNNSKFEDKRFYIMSIEDAISRGHSDKYMQSIISYETYKELYANEPEGVLTLDQHNEYTCIKNGGIYINEECIKN